MIGAGLMVTAGLVLIVAGSVTGMRGWNASRATAAADQAVSELVSHDLAHLRERQIEEQRLLRAAWAYLERHRKAAPP